LPKYYGSIAALQRGNPITQAPRPTVNPPPQSAVGMSNTHVGAVYDHIIQEVINAVRVDFEENGVDDGILDELKKVRTSLSICVAIPPKQVAPGRALSPWLFGIKSIGKPISTSEEEGKK